MMRATNWQFLPIAGGLLDQPDALMSDIFAIEAAYNVLQEQKSG